VKQDSLELISRWTTPSSTDGDSSSSVTPTASVRWAYPNIHSDLMKTASGTGVVDSQVYRWDPDGMPIAGGCNRICRHLTLRMVGWVSISG
jgi:hypothetical protein